VGDAAAAAAALAPVPPPRLPVAAQALCASVAALDLLRHCSETAVSSVQGAAVVLTLFMLLLCQRPGRRVGTLNWAVINRVISDINITLAVADPDSNTSKLHVMSITLICFWCILGQRQHVAELAAGAARAAEALGQPLTALTLLKLAECAAVTTGGSSTNDGGTKAAVQQLGSAATHLRQQQLAAAAALQAVGPLPMLQRNISRYSRLYIPPVSSVHYTDPNVCTRRRRCRVGLRAWQQCRQIGRRSCGTAQLGRLRCRTSWRS
jgi:hypothetical protein